jgi:hypothetical protein
VPLSVVDTDPLRDRELVSESRGREPDGLGVREGVRVTVNSSEVLRVRESLTTFVVECVMTAVRVGITRRLGVRVSAAVCEAVCGVEMEEVVVRECSIDSEDVSEGEDDFENVVVIECDTDADSCTVVDSVLVWVTSREGEGVSDGVIELLRVNGNVVVADTPADNDSVGDAETVID